MEITEVFYPHSRAEWRAWLRTHHLTKTEVWVRTFRKASGQPALPYEDLVQESLCFGWIMDIKGESRRAEAQKRLDYMIKMTGAGKMYGTIV